MRDEAVISAYEELSPDPARIRTTSYRWGGRRRARSAFDYLGLDLLSGGVRQVWAVAEVLAVTARDRVLEIGCGLGGPMRYIAQRYGCQVTGVDVTPRQLEIARSLTRGLTVEPQLEFVHADARALPFREHVFTRAYSIEAFVHVSDKPAAFREAARVLARGGRFVLRDFIVHVAGLEVALFEEAVFPLALAGYEAAMRDAGFEGVCAVDRTSESREAYAVAGELYGTGPLSIRKALAALDTLQPGIRPPLRRYLSPGRAWHLLRYSHDRALWALDLFGDHVLLDGVRKMCQDIVGAYDSGAMSFYELAARKPA